MASESTKVKMTEVEWNAMGERLFGPDRMKWRFVCPICGHVASIADWKSAGASSGEAAFSCVGRHIEGARRAFGDTGPGPCDYAGGGLFGFNPVEILGENGKVTNYFAFAEATT